MNSHSKRRDTMQSAEIKWKMLDLDNAVSGFRFAHSCSVGIIMQKRPSRSSISAEKMEDEEHPRGGDSSGD